jgi:hypothetical protein
MSHSTKRSGARGHLRTAYLVKLLAEAEGTTPKVKRLYPTQLVDLIGVERSVELLKAYGGAKLPKLYDLLVLLRRAAIIRDAEDGYTLAELVGRYQLAPRTIQNLLKQHRKAKKIREAEQRSRATIQLLTGVA